MGSVKRKTTARKSKTRMLTKKEKVYRRVAYVKKIMDKKIRKKRSNKKVLAEKRKKVRQAENESVKVYELRDAQESTTQQEISILGLMGLGSEQIDNKLSINWEEKLSETLIQANYKSLDNPEVRKVYSEIGKIFSTYRSGKVPKALKVIPNLQKWRQVLQITKPENWTAQAMFQAVNIFASNFDPIRAQQFYRQYLTPAVKKDLAQNKKLNYHYYQALIKALYKTNAWFKGILFEFCTDQTRIGQIRVIESLLIKMKIPVISASVAVIKMMNMKVTNAVLHYLKALINKNYSFPKRIIPMLTMYMMSFQTVNEAPNVVWQQLLLAICQHYGNYFDEMNKASLSSLAKKYSHKLITPQILKCF